ncbi:SDR family oxidoreductase [Shewanella sp. Isolate11]|uniref:SDR family oxidoreductase n=1 Tax=Shewanella sp. Isolate11 TaxID=2908530 RepID=UPI001EFE59E1|nr:SDR family oxidoreductase [Shewanella sp. Isolate11]MCG9696339.1 SDR family oxidoreductase [Shewanella sp. Isolate11]
MINSVAVVGCGWFGLPLAKALVTQGIKVSGSKRDLQKALGLNQDGIDGFKLDLTHDVKLNPPDLAKLHADAIVINIPPGLRRGDNDYLERLSRLVDLIGAHIYQKIVFISTTGVYPANGKLMTEADAEAHSNSSETLLKAESFFASATVVRFAGLMGPKRHPGRFLAGKTGLKGANLAVNMTHLDDAVAAVSCILAHLGPLAPIYNVCTAHHPSKQAFYQQAAEGLELTAPQFDTLGEANEDKRVDGSLISRQLGYQYRHVDLFEALQCC